MKRQTSKIREEIARLQEQLKHAETREAERIGRIALRAGLGDIAIDEVDLHAGFEQLGQRFRTGRPDASKSEAAGGFGRAQGQASSAGTAPGGDRED